MSQAYIIAKQLSPKLGVCSAFWHLKASESLYTHVKPLDESLKATRTLVLPSTAPLQAGVIGRWKCNARSSVGSIASGWERASGCKYGVGERCPCEAAEDDGEVMEMA